MDGFDEISEGMYVMNSEGMKKLAEFAQSPEGQLVAKEMRDEIKRVESKYLDSNGFAFNNMEIICDIPNNRLIAKGNQNGVPVDINRELFDEETRKSLIVPSVPPKKSLMTLIWRFLGFCRK